VEQRADVDIAGSLVDSGDQRTGIFVNVLKLQSSPYV
jgi:hypothetical protein